MSKDDYNRAAGSDHHERQEPEQDAPMDIWERIALFALSAGVVMVILMALAFGGG